MHNVNIELKNLNQQISDALNKACDKKNLSESSKKKIFDFIDLMAIGKLGEAETQTRVDGILRAISNESLKGDS